MTSVRRCRYEPPAPQGDAGLFVSLGSAAGLSYRIGETMEDMGKKSDSDAVPPQAGELVDLQALRELIELMGENDLVELEYEYGDLAVRLSKRANSAPEAGAPAARPAEKGGAAAGAAHEAEDRYLEITSPMVGTFYWSAGSDAEPFVSVGDAVNEGTVVCLIEAMKVFNEIKAGVSGTITKICVENEAAVEFAQVLFLVEPG